MDEHAALAAIAEDLEAAGDDAAVVEDLVVTTDMLHETTDFPSGTTHYTAGWRAVGASFSDVAAMGGDPLAAVAVYAAPAFDPDEIEAFLAGASDVSAAVGAEYVGGDLDQHEELTVSSTAIGRTNTPVRRAGANPGETLCVTGTLGRTLGALECFESGTLERGNELFQFQPRTAAGQILQEYATAMMDSSDGLARSLHQLATASDCGFSVESSTVPVTEAVDTSSTPLEAVLTFGEDFELVCTIPQTVLADVHSDCPVPVTEIGQVTESGVSLDGEALPDEGYTHGGR